MRASALGARLGLALALVALPLSASLAQESAPPPQPVACNDSLLVMDVAFSRFTGWLSTNRDGVTVDYSNPSQGVGHAAVEPRYIEALQRAPRRVLVAQSYTFDDRSAQSLKNILIARSETSIPHVLALLPGLALNAAPPLIGFGATWLMDQLLTGLEVTRKKAAAVAPVIVPGGQLQLVHWLDYEAEGRMVLHEIVVYHAQIEGQDHYAYLASCRYPVVVSQPVRLP